MSKVWTPSWLLLPCTVACWADPITYLRLQEQVASSPSSNPLCCMAFDSGALNRNFLTRQISGGTGPGLGTPYGISYGLINGSQLRGYVTAGSSFSSNLSATADLTATWVDTITPIGLPPGTPVSLRITNSLNSIIGLAGAIPDGNFATAYSVLSLTFPGSSNNPRLSVHNTDLNPVSNAQTASLVILCTSGVPCFTLSETLTLTAHATAQGMVASVDARNTNDIFIDLLTPGESVSAASGVTYSASTPEPATGGLLLAGMVGALVVRRRQKATRGEVARFIEGADHQ